MIQTIIMLIIVLPALYFIYSRATKAWTSVEREEQEKKILKDLEEKVEQETNKTSVKVTQQSQGECER